MRKFQYLLPLLLLMTLNAFGQSNFEKGLSAYNDKKYAEAKESLSAALEENPNNLAVLNNLALTYFELNQKGKALAFWLKALKLDPTFEEAEKGISYVRSKLTPNSFSVKETDFESLRKSVLSGLSLNLLFALTAFTFLITGFHWIKHASYVKRSLNDETAVPPISILSIVFSLLFVLCVGTLFLKTWDHLTPRAIVIKEKVDLKIAPGADQSKIVELNEGSEVDIGVIKEEWVQVKIPGNYSGWLNKEDIQIIL